MNLKAFIPLTKVDEEKRMVWGYASTEALDSHNEVVARAAIGKALDDYMRFANIREMHQLSAVGVAKEATMDDTGLFIGAHIVDDPAWEKVKAGVYKGFSIGGKCLKKTGKTIEELTLTEISIVDRPANPECTFTAWKADGAQPAEAGQEELALDLSASVVPVTATESVAKSEGAVSDGEPVAKSVWNAQTILAALGNLRDALRCAEYEASEGDHAPATVEALRSVLADLGAAAQKYLGEEVANMLAPRTAKADGADDVAKAGRRFSATTKAALKAAHDALKAADKALADLGYDADDEAEKAAEGGAIHKAVEAPFFDADLTAALAKAALPGVVEGAHARDLFKTALAELAKARSRITELEAQPAAPKGVLKAIDKGHDLSGGGQPAVEPVRKADGSIDQLATAIKAVHMGASPARA